MRLRTKLLFLFLASGLFLLLEGLGAYWSLRTVGRGIEGLQVYTQTDDICGQIKVELAQVPDLEELASPPSGRSRRALKRHADRTLILCRSLTRLTTSASARGAVAQISSVVGAYRRLGSAYARALEAGRGGFRELDLAEPAFQSLRQLREEGVIDPVGHEARLATQAVIERAEELTWYTLAGLSLSVLFTLVGAFVLSRAAARPFIRLLRAAREVSQGKLDTQVPIEGQDELGQMARAFNAMTRRLSEVYEGLEEEVRKRTEELQQRRRELEWERRLAAIGRLATGVAHEVSNPLTVIAGAAEGLRDRARDPELQGLAAFEDFPEYLELIEREAYRLKRLVRRLLDFSRSRPTLSQDLDLHALSEDAVALARMDPRVKQHPIHILGPSCPILVRGDPDRLKEALLNLLFNALAAVEEEGEVWVTTAKGGGLASVEVRDSGHGFTPQEADRLFEPFYTTRREGEGTGLGLALVYGTVERHSGHITARSAGPGAGAIFRITLPLGSPREADP